jgi:hypothetical protein
MSGVLASADGLLRGRASPVFTWRTLLVLIVVFGPIYGAAMGSYAFASPERTLQVIYSAMKVPLLLMATTAICLPAFFVLSTVVGTRDDFREAFAAILAGQAAMSIMLASLAPVTRLSYFSLGNYSAALLFNGVVFAVGTGAAQLVMRRGYAPLVLKNPTHRLMFWAWAVMYVFVGVQMGWTLRPFVGSPGAFPTFFRDGAFTNAYVEVARIVARVFGG